MLYATLYVFEYHALHSRKEAQVHLIAQNSKMGAGIFIVTLTNFFLSCLKHVFIVAIIILVVMILLAVSPSANFLR
jgi:hypothetical protein